MKRINIVIAMVLIALVQLSEGCKDRDQVQFDFRDEWDSLGSIMHYFDLKRDSQMTFEVFNDLTGQMIGFEYWLYERDTVVFDITYAHYRIARYYTLDSTSHNSIDLHVASGGLLLHYKTYRYPFMSVAYAEKTNDRDKYKKDTSYILSVGPQYKRFRQYSPVEYHFYNHQYYSTIRIGRDSLATAGVFAPFEEKFEDYYFGKGIGLFKMTERLESTTNSIRDVYRLTKWRKK